MISGSSEAALVEVDQLFQPMIELLRIGGGFGDAVSDVILQQGGLQAAQGGMNGGNGVQDFRAIAVLLNHPADPLDLADDSIDPADQGLALAAVALHGEK